MWAEVYLTAGDRRCVPVDGKARAPAIPCIASRRSGPRWGPLKGCSSQQGSAHISPGGQSRPLHFPPPAAPSHRHYRGASTLHDAPGGLEEGERNGTDTSTA
ncbi:unnamed protein product [Arctogadus glacialis]